jgi:integrase
MERPKRPYSVHRRPSARKNRHIYYVRFRDPDTGAYRSAVSTGQTSKAGACNWADEKLKAGGLVKAIGRRCPTFAQFSCDFWNWESSPYIKARQARGRHFSRTYADTAAGYVRRHLIPAFGDRKINEIRHSHIEGWVLALYQEGKVSPTSVNRYLSVLRIMLREAFEQGLIGVDPSHKVKEVAERPTVKGILSPEETRALFDPENIDGVWDGNRKLWLANLLAASTGMRSGEVRGLQVRHVHERYLEVQRSWEEGYGLKGAKWDSERIVPVHPRVAAALAQMVSDSGFTDPDDLVFCGERRGLPIGKRALVESLYRATMRIGIAEDERKRRNITFHSWRHFFNSMCRGHVSDAKLQLVTGHRTQEMTERYTHVVEEDLKEIRAVQERIFEPATA